MKNLFRFRFRSSRLTSLFSLLLAVAFGGLGIWIVRGQDKDEPAPTPKVEGTAGIDDPGFVDLFNGVDLSGWVDVNTSPETWSVKDGLLVCTGNPIGVMRSERMYENFVLIVE